VQMLKSIEEKDFGLGTWRRRREVSRRSTINDQIPRTAAFLRLGSPAESQGKFRGGQSRPTGKNSARKTPKPPAKWHVTLPPVHEDPENPEKSTIGILEKLEIPDKNAFIPASDARLSESGRRPERLVTGNPPVRSDEREAETDRGMRLSRDRRETPIRNYADAYAAAYAAAPRLASTTLAPGNQGEGCGSFSSSGSTDECSR